VVAARQGPRFSKWAGGGRAWSRGSAVAALLRHSSAVVVAIVAAYADGHRYHRGGGGFIPGAVAGAVIGGAHRFAGLLWRGRVIITAMLPLRPYYDDQYYDDQCDRRGPCPRAAMMRLIASRGSVPMIPNRETYLRQRRPTGTPCPVTASDHLFRLSKDGAFANAPSFVVRIAGAGRCHAGLSGAGGHRLGGHASPDPPVAPPESPRGNPLGRKKKYLPCEQAGRSSVSRGAGGKYFPLGIPEDSLIGWHRRRHKTTPCFFAFFHHI